MMILPPFPDNLDLTPISRWPTTLRPESLRAVLDTPLDRSIAGSLMQSPDESPQVSIVIVTLDGLVFSRLCIESLLAHNPTRDYEVIVVDNGSSDGTVEYLNELARLDPRIRVLFNERNIGFAAASNRGVQQARGTILIFLNNDVIVSAGWHTGIVNHLADRRVGLLGVVTNRAGNEAEIEVPYSTYGELQRFARDYMQAHSRDIFDIRTVTMFCAALRREVWNAVGPLDERFEVGLFEDDDYAMRVREAGYRVVCAEDVFVHHFGQASIGKLARTGQYGEIYRANRTRWEAKWGRAWTPHERREKPTYRTLVGRIRARVHELVPSAATLAVISKGDAELLELEGRRAWHFPQAEDGTYAGFYPQNSEACIAELERLRAKGAQFLVIPATARWWLTHYARFGKYLQTKYGASWDDQSPATIVALFDQRMAHHQAADVTASSQSDASVSSVSPEAYRELTDQVRDCVSAHVRPGSVVLMVSKGDDELLQIAGYRAWHFPRDEAGVYAGHHPATSVEAIAHLRRLYSKGAQYLVFPWTSRWWLDHYTEFASHLNTAHQLTALREGVCVIYELCQSPAFEAWEILDEEDDSPESASASAEMTHLVDLTFPKSRAMRVLTVLARFGTTMYPHADRKLDEIVRRQMPTIDRTVLIVDNALPRDRVDERDGGFVIGGDNSAREFSAFDRAVDFVASDIWSYDLVHFATSAFNTLHVAYLERFDSRLLDALAGRSVCAGHLDCYNEPIEVLTYHSQHWVRSCFFLLPPTEVKALGSFVTIADGKRFFSGHPDEPFRHDAPISRRYREYVTQWLTGGDIGQGVKWHSSFALTPQTLPEFEQKARAILNEQLLGIRLLALGCHLIDVTWLSTVLQHQNLTDISWSTPWREQLAARDHHRLVLPAQSDGVGVVV